MVVLLLKRVNRIMTTQIRGDERMVTKSGLKSRNDLCSQKMTGTNVVIYMTFSNLSTDCRYEPVENEPEKTLNSLMLLRCSP